MQTRKTRGPMTKVLVLVGCLAPPTGLGAWRIQTSVVFYVYRYTPCLPVAGAIVSLDGEGVHAVTDSLGVARADIRMPGQTTVRLDASGRRYEIRLVTERERIKHVPIDLDELDQISPGEPPRG